MSHDGQFKSIPRDESVFDIGLERAVALLKEPKQFGGRGELVSAGGNIAVEPHDAHRFPVPPKRERLAVGVEQVGKRLQLGPLALVVRIFELPRVSALPGRLHFNEPYQRLGFPGSYRDGEIGAGLSTGKRRFADQSDVAARAREVS